MAQGGPAAQLRCQAANLGAQLVGLGLAQVAEGTVHQVRARPGRRLGRHLASDAGACVLAHLFGQCLLIGLYHILQFLDRPLTHAGLGQFFP